MGGGAGGGGGGASGKLKKAVRKLLGHTWLSFCRRDQQNMVIDSCAAVSPVCRDSSNSSSLENENISSEIIVQGVSHSSPSSEKNLCAICLDPLSYISGGNLSQPVFTAQCSHAFHFACITSNIRHGSVTCPICRAHWTQLPRNVNTRCLLHNKLDPAPQILSNSIANIPGRRDALLPSIRYNDDDPIVPDYASNQSRLHLSLHPNLNVCPHEASGSVPCPRISEILPSHGEYPYAISPRNRAYLCVKLLHQPGIDLVLVASSNGPHLRLMKQAMALTVFSLRPTDRLAIITYSSGAARAFPLRRMTSYSKRAALQVIDNLFYAGQADPIDGIRKGVKILEDRLHKNQRSCILHLTDAPSRSFHWIDPDQFPVPVHRFHIRDGFNSPDSIFSHRFEEFLAGMLGGGVEDVQLRIGEMGIVVSIEELRGGEERRVPVFVGESGKVSVAYIYKDDESIKSGEVVVGIGDKGEISECWNECLIGGRISSVENWSYHDPSMARRWSKHLHGYRLYP
ncbi:probable E3 ubiquitin-protein ligase EDA40 [Andrographis paniculata]|uniref:probable E3 ubiquitin-protein ligase EDA40 n=1 Tax=Andrographis paniculata TaxID=175694 RepID=UPI0021E75C0B|nr:probable E3 ubiquitin-protein ligase EDA40 [Andrographis paniculata]